VSDTAAVVLMVGFVLLTAGLLWTAEKL